MERGKEGGKKEGKKPVGREAARQTGKQAGRRAGREDGGREGEREGVNRPVSVHGPRTLQENTGGRHSSDRAGAAVLSLEAGGSHSGLGWRLPFTLFSVLFLKSLREPALESLLPPRMPAGGAASPGWTQAVASSTAGCWVHGYSSSCYCCWGSWGHTAAVTVLKLEPESF